ncbi:LPS biosynthesis protein [Deinococcus seoulensis]|uniref:LPS biosynthesis protein n=1 Tax=Deinococcus seoulensis TaxID=1837379 RepID=A0ABQ2RRN7_9DEIO|nr:dTDP-4-dehydrorhamnose 3,5-epimerase family protein [Deinococcus seoulensis]GGR58918.1 LPS biosynthesis protein [Deinococcus seoulensis]
MNDDARPPLHVPLTGPAHAALTHETYPPAPDLSGVWLRPLSKHRAGNGAFMEVLRLGDGVTQHLPDELHLRQLSVSWAAPGRLNAFHLHVKAEQNELWCVLSGQLTVWLADVRAGSPTSGGLRRVILSGEQPALLHIPSGVAHGYRASVQGATLLYGMDAQFDPQDPNEGRLPWDHFGAHLWDEDRG